MIYTFKNGLRKGKTAMNANTNTLESEILKACRRMDGVVGMRSYADTSIVTDRPDFVCQIVQLDSLQPSWIDDEGHDHGFWCADSVHNPQVILFHGRTWEEVSQEMNK